MGRLKKFLKDSAGLLITAGIIGGGYCYLSRPEGVQLKAEADGFLTAKEKKETLEIFNSNESVESYNPALKSFVNDFDVFIANENKARGFPTNRFDEDIHVLITDNDKINSACGEWGAGCWNHINNTMYLDYSDSFWITHAIWHEAGHNLRYHYEPVKELFSQSNELYSKMKAYCFDQEIGINFLNATLTAPANYCKPNERHLPYALGNIGFLAQANKAEGDLERALHNILNDRQTDGILDSIEAFFTGAEGCLECDMQNAARRYPDLCSAYYNEYRKLVDLPHFIEGFQRHMSRDDAQELMEYLRLRLDFSIAYNTATGDNNNISLDEIFSGIGERAEAFVTTSSALRNYVNKHILEELNLTFCGDRNVKTCDYP